MLFEVKKKRQHGNYKGYYGGRGRSSDLLSFTRLSAKKGGCPSYTFFLLFVAGQGGDKVLGQAPLTDELLLPLVSCAEQEAVGSSTLEPRGLSNSNSLLK